MAKLLKQVSSPKSLPKEKRRLLLPQPKYHYWTALFLVLLPVFFILHYSIFSWFELSKVTVATVVQVVMFVFMVSVVMLIITLMKFMYALFKKKRSASIKNDKKIITLTLVLLLSMMFLSVIIYLVQY